MGGGGKGGGGKSILPTDFSITANIDAKPIDITTDSTINHDGTVNMNTSMTGDKNAPIAMMMLGDESQPISMKADVGMDMTTNSSLNHDGTVNMNTSMKGAKDEPVAVMMIGDQQQPLSAYVIGDKDKPVALSMELQNLPRFTVDDIKDLTTPEIKVSLPGQHNVCFKILGQELFSVCYGGEQQLITEPYVPSEHNNCVTPNCDVDTRPFPESPK